MAVEKYNAFWRKALAIGILPFAALGVAGCDNSEPAEEPAAEEGALDEDPAFEGDRPENVEEVEEEEQVIEDELPVDG